MRILINALSALQGGGQTYILNLLQNIPDNFNAEIIVLAPTEFELPKSNQYERMRVNWPVNNPYMRAIWERYILPSVLRKQKIDVLFCPGGLVITPLPRGCLSVTMFRNMIPFDMKQRRRYPLGSERFRNWILHRLMLRSMIGADLVIFISEWARSIVQNEAKQKIKSVVIPHGVNTQFRIKHHSLEYKPVWLSEEDYLLYVSTLDFYKDQLELVRGYALALKVGLKHKLVLVGPENTKYGQIVRNEIVRLKLQNKVIVAGKASYSELPFIYQHSLVNIFASECENCPNILLEALASGRPVLCSSSQPMPEFAGDAVQYFNPSSPKDFAEKIVELVNDQERLTLLANKALERSKKYNWKDTAKKTWDAINHLSDAYAN